MSKIGWLSCRELLGYDKYLVNTLFALACVHVVNDEFSTAVPSLTQRVPNINNHKPYFRLQLMRSALVIFSHELVLFERREACGTGSTMILQPNHGLLRYRLDAYCR